MKAKLVKERLDEDNRGRNPFEHTGPEDDGMAADFGKSVYSNSTSDNIEDRIPDSSEIREMALSMDEKEFDEWWWETVYKK